MPRKKKKTEFEKMPLPQPLSSTEVQAKISNVLNGLPPDLYIILAQTPSQIRLWNQERHFYKCVAARMASKLSLDAPPDYSKMPKHQRERIELTSWRFLSFGSMMWANWQTLKPRLDDVEFRAIPIMPDGESVAGWFPTMNGTDINTPMEAMLYAMRNFAICDMSALFGPKEYTEATDSSLRRGLEKQRRARAASASGMQKKKAKDWHSSLKRFTSWGDLEEFCFVAAKRSANTPEGKAAIAELEKALMAYESFAMKVLHPQGRKKKS